MNFSNVSCILCVFISSGIAFLTVCYIGYIFHWPIHFQERVKRFFQMLPTYSKLYFTLEFKSEIPILKKDRLSEFRHSFKHFLYIFIVSFCKGMESSFIYRISIMWISKKLLVSSKNMGYTNNSK